MARLIALRRGEPIFDGKGFGTRRFNDYIEELTTQINTTTEETGEISTQLAQSQQTLAVLTEIGKKQEVVVNVTTDYTIRPYEIASCRNVAPITVTLEANPIVGDILNIKRRGASITVSGAIDGKTSKLINILNYSMKLAYDGTEWIEV